MYTRLVYKYRWQYNYVNLIPKGSFSRPNPLPLSLSLQGTGRGQSLAMRLELQYSRLQSRFWGRE